MSNVFGRDPIIMENSRLAASYFLVCIFLAYFYKVITALFVSLLKRYICCPLSFFFKDVLLGVLIGLLFSTLNDVFRSYFITFVNDFCCIFRV